MKGLLPEVWSMVTVLAATSTTASLPLFGDRGPQVDDVRAVVTSSGWFEVLTTGTVMTSPDLLTANMTNINDTHADVSLWKPAASSMAGVSEAVTVAIAKRPSSPERPYTWPAALYEWRDRSKLRTVDDPAGGRTASCCSGEATAVRNMSVDAPSSCKHSPM